MGVINLKHIEVFHAIMRTGSVTCAARMLNVTQPAVSSVLKHFAGDREAVRRQTVIAALDGLLQLGTE